MVEGPSIILRNKTPITKSEKVKAFRECMSRCLKGKHFKTRSEQTEFFRETVKQCKHESKEKETQTGRSTNTA